MSKSVVMKILTVGDGGVGKTTLLHRYINGEFLSDTQMTLGVAFFNQQLTIEGHLVMLQLWDFGGQEQFRFMLKNYALGARGAILMFDLTRPSTIDHMDEWVQICREDNPNLPIILVGTKLDMTEQIMIQDDFAKELMDSFDLFDYMKISSKSGEGVNDVFQRIAKKLIG